MTARSRPDDRWYALVIVVGIFLLVVAILGTLWIMTWKP